MLTQSEMNFLALLEKDEADIWQRFKAHRNKIMRHGDTKINATRKSLNWLKFQAESQNQPNTNDPLNYFSEEQKKKYWDCWRRAFTTETSKPMITTPIQRPMPSAKTGLKLVNQANEMPSEDILTVVLKVKAPRSIMPKLLTEIVCQMSDIQMMALQMGGQGEFNVNIHQ